MDPATFERWGPYLSFGSNAATEMRIAWKSPKLTHSRWVKYGTTTDCSQIVEEKWCEPSQSHVIILKDLIPNTKYYYQISRDEKKTYSFKTGLDPVSNVKQAFSFNIYGDQHASPSNNIAFGFETALELTPDHDFGVAVGDSINDGNDQTHWNAYFAAVSSYLKEKPLMNATGNHDTDNEDKYCRFLQAWHHPYVNPAIGGYYHMEYGNAVFIFIDSNNAGGWEPTPGDEQMEWLEATLQKFAKKDKWIFLFFHHEVFSTGDFSCKFIMENLYRPLCQEYQVDAVFYGHDHHYECFWVDKEADYGGTLYFVTGAHGGNQYVDYNIQWHRNGKTKYIWPGRVLNVRKTGVPPPSTNITNDSKTFRNDELVKNCQLLGVLEPHFLNIKIDGDIAEIKAIGWQHQLFHHLKIQRAGCGRKFSADSEIAVYEMK